MAKTDLRVDWATHDAAKYAVENWHYSGCLPHGKLVKVGAWEYDRFIGVVLFGRGANPSLCKPYHLKQNDMCELTRVALTDHVCQTSRIMSIAVKFLSKYSPGLRLIVSFADANEGHHGGIYQASGWIYTGETPNKTHFKDRNGRIWHSRRATSSGYTPTFGTVSKCAKRADCDPVYLIGKHRYLFPLDEEMRAKIAPLAKPYPKRPKKPDDPDQGNRGRGSTDPDAPHSDVFANA